MKKILNLIYSTKATLWLLLVFAIAMATATFVENSYDTPTAYKLIYGSFWFELVMVLLALNFIGNIGRYNMLSKKKYSGFLFHAAFILIIIGAGVTRYFGYEGLMHIREGESTNVIVSPNHVFKIFAIDKGNEIHEDIPFDVNDPASGLDFKKTISTKEDGDLKIELKNYIRNVTTALVENAEDGIDVMKLNVLDHGTEMDLFVVDKEISGSTSIPFSFNNPSNTSGINIFEKNGKYYLMSGLALTSVTLPYMEQVAVMANTEVELTPQTQFTVVDNEFKFIFNGGFHKAKKQFISGPPIPNAPSALMVDIAFKNKNYEVPVFVNADGYAEFQYAHVDGISLLLGYGEKEIKLPFAIGLRDFIVERYPGSSNPSSYASEVTILDQRVGPPEDFRIYMNHILDHDGYRFFQSSYDKDEKGTVLSVNHDFWGTWITYIGYALLALGFILNLTNKNSRFRILGRSIHEIKRLRMAKTLVLIVGLVSTQMVTAQETVLAPVSQAHAERLGHLVVQTVNGRFEPLHTLAYDVMHKISRKDKFDFPGKGEMDAMQMMLDLVINAQYWKAQPLIYVREKSVADILGITGKYASYNDMVDQKGAPKLGQYADDAFRKKPQDQNTFDKEVMKVSERFDIYMMLTQGSLLRIFPEPVAGSHLWVSWDNPQAQIVMQDNYNLINELQIPQLNYNNVMGAYLNAVFTATGSGDYARADHTLDLISTIQRNSAVAMMLPSESKVSMEILYNKINIFIVLKNLYGLLALVLLVLAYTENFMEKKNKLVSSLLNFFLIILGIAFVAHTVGMGLRWYLSGHAPWSNGYEALLLVGWAGILAGFSFIRYSKIPLAATALLAFFTLMTASHSSYDPQITNLQPVLKSYWLIVHVATLTISYGFLGLAFILGLFNLSLFLLKNKTNATRFNLLIKELSNINEMNMTIGLMLATIGTFLGGVWANESWGRYWGWDAKETWALIIVMVYSIVLHLRLVDKLRGDYFFTVGSILGFSSVLMTFIGVNYYLSKGMHSYGQGDTPVFPIWAWIMILSVFALIVWAWYKEKAFHKTAEESNEQVSDEE